MKTSGGVDDCEQRARGGLIDINRFDLSALRAMWASRREAAAALRARTDPSGMTRPARDPDEREFLREQCAEGPFVEVDEPGWREWRRRRSRPRP